MASPSNAFKMKCPSCEASVTIRDASLAGKKVDCPKCKFRFVVEAPAEAGDNEAEAAPAKKDAAAAKGKIKPSDGAAKSKNKPLPKLDDANDDGKKKKKKAGSNMTLIVGAGLGVLAIGVLVLYFTVFSGGDDSGPAPKKDQAKAAPKNKQGQKSNDPKGGKADTVAKDVPMEKETPVDVVAADITNMLPEDANLVVQLSGADILKTPIGAVLFEKSSDSAQGFRRLMGFSGDDVERIVYSKNKAGSFFSVVRFKNEQKIENLQAAMQLEPAPKTFAKRTVYVIKSNKLFEMLSKYLNMKLPAKAAAIFKAGDVPIALCLTNSRTLVVANQPALEQFLKNNLKRTFQTTYVAPDAVDAPDKKTAPPAGDPKKEARKAITKNPSYLTIDPALKIMLNQLEQDKPAAVSFACEFDVAALIRELKEMPNLPRGFTVLKAPVIGVVVRQMDEKKLDVVAGIDYDRSDTALQQALDFQKLAIGWASQLSVVLKTPIVVGDPNTLLSWVDGASEPLPMPRPVRDVELVAAPRPGQQVIDVLQVVAPKGKTDGNAPPPTSTLAIGAIDKYVIARLRVDWNADVYYEYISPSIRSTVDLVKGEALMFSDQVHWHMLPVAIRSMAKSGTVPPAAYPRKTDVARFSVSYPPEQRVSWLTDLLPFLGHQSLSQSIRRDEAWNSPDNLQAGSTWIPQFLDAQNPEITWRARVPSLPGHDMGATHFVGLSGVGMDAANYPDTPEFQKKFGMLGYNRQTKFADVVAGDGLANTIFMIEVPPNIQRAWIRGGGSTMQGVPETGSIKPFLSVTKDGKRGTNVLMADGSIRFLSESTDDSIFKALTTYKGGEKIDNLDKIAPLVVPLPEEKKESKLVTPPKK